MINIIDSAHHVFVRTSKCFQINEKQKWLLLILLLLLFLAPASTKLACEQNVRTQRRSHL